MAAADVAAVDAELQKRYREQEEEEAEAEVIVVVKTMIQSLTKETLIRLALGNQKEVEKALVQKPAPSRFPTLYRNLKARVAAVFPGCALKNNKTGNTICGERFTGFYYARLATK